MFIFYTESSAIGQRFQMTNLLKALQDISKNNPNELNQNDKTMLDAIWCLEENAEAMCKLKGTKQASSDFMTFVKPLLDCETASKGNEKSWRIVIDMPVEGDTYSSDPTIQICSGEPSYHRYVMKFGENGVETAVETACVVKEPDLSVLTAEHNEGNTQTLADVKDFFDAAGIQRVAILGSARVFAHPDFVDPKEPAKGQVEPNKNNVWAQKYTNRVQNEINKLLDVMDKEETQFTTVNGGWAGVKENSTGIPLISNLVGAITDANQEFSLPPVTIMPKVGAFDRVVTRSDACNSTPLPSVEETVGHKTPEISTYFEVPGGWGDDSKYLVGFSTGLVVFEPYGFWTNIEIANGAAQEKPVAIIADPENLEPGGKYYEQMKNGERFAEIKIPLPGNAEGSYRVYRDAGEAAQWIHDQTVQNLEKKQIAPTQVPVPEPVNHTKNMREQMNALRAANEEELENTAGFVPG